MPLRPSQVETLRVVGEDIAITPYELARATKRPIHDAEARLEGLAYEEFLDGQDGPITTRYRLTQLGREALEGEAR